MLKGPSFSNHDMIKFTGVAVPLKSDGIYIMNMENDKVERVPGENIPVENLKYFLNVTEMVRSVQRREGNPDCFQKAKGPCGHRDCFWRPWCVESTVDSGKEE